MAVVEDMVANGSYAECADPFIGAAQETATTRSNGLRRLLVMLDAMAAATAWTVALVLPAATGGDAAGVVRALAVTAAMVAGTLALICWQRLYLSRFCSVPLEEIRRLGRVAAVLALVMGVLSFDLGLFALGQVVLGASLTFAFLVIMRSAYRSWISAHRKLGRFCRPVVLVGANEDAQDLYQILTDHPEMGFCVVGVVSDDEPSASLPVPHLGGIEDAVTAVRGASATGTVVVASALEPAALNRVVRQLFAAEIHVHVSSGLRGIGHHRLHPLPLAHEPLFYIEPQSLTRWQHANKRALDIVLASALLLLALPVLAIAALLIRLEDGGPLLFRQVRVGIDGTRFTLYKLRTMVPNAEQRLLELVDGNRRQGPLFKVASDPRVTRIGGSLRRTSLDELPQLWNVLNGTMSLVGPRPALPDEVEQFDDQLRTRTNVLPGITGLWQVEARDNPAFGPYRRLDLYYIENRSIGLDLGILCATAGVVLARTIRSGWRHGPLSDDVADHAVIID